MISIKCPVWLILNCPIFQTGWLLIVFKYGKDQIYDFPQLPKSNCGKWYSPPHTKWLCHREGHSVQLSGTDNKWKHELEVPLLENSKQNITYPWCDEQAKTIPTYVCNETNVWIFDTIPSTIRDNLLGIWLDWDFQTSKTCHANHDKQKFNAHTEPIFKELKMLKIKDIFNIQCLKFWFKFVNNCLPSFFK